MNKISAWLTPPVFEDEEKTRRARLLNGIIWTFLTITLFGGIALFILQGPDVRVGLAVAVFLGLGGVYALLRRGYIQPASLVLVLVLSLTTTATLYRLGGLRFPGVAFFILVILIAGLLLDVGPVMAVLGLLIVMIVGLYYAETAGLIVYTQANEPLPVVLLANIIILAFITVVIYLYTTQVKQALARARRDEQALVGSNREFQQEIAERRQAEAQLQFQKTLLECQGEAAIDGILVVSPDGEWLSFNRRFTQMWGIPDQVARQRSSLAARQWVRGKVVDLEKFLAEVEYLVQHPLESGQSEVELIDGRVFERYSAPVRSAEGVHYGRVWYYHDISERKQTEQTLRRRAEEMTALYETSLEMNTELDPSLLLPAIVRRAATLLGVEMGSLLLSQPDRETLEVVAVYNRPASDIGLTIKMGQGMTGRIAQTGQPLAVSDYRRWPERTAYFADEQIGRSLGVPLKQGQQVIGVLNVFDRDPGEFSQGDAQLLNLFAAYAAITIRNARLFEAEQHHREIAETLSEIARVANASLDLNEVLNHIIQGLEKILSYESVTILLIEAEQFRIVATDAGVEARRLVGALYPMTSLRFNHYVVQTQQVQLVPDTHQTEHFSPVTKAASPVRSVIGIPLISQNNVIGVMSIGSYTPHRYSQADVQVAFRFAQEVAITLNNARLYQQVQRYNQELEAMVAARTRELEATQEKLIRQEKLAFLGQLAGGVGHELRNPLGVISNAVYFLKMVLNQADETVKEYLDLIDSRVQEADKIVSDLLNLSRNRTAAKSEVAARQLIDEVLARQPAPDGITIAVDLPPDLPALFVDAQQIRQVLLNLVANAYQAMPDGGALTITAKVVNKDADPPPASPLPPSVALTVADTGHGMSPETMVKIFEPLYTTKPKGIGLGLAVSKNLVEVNDGTIEVESSEGQGTTFTVTLPNLPGL